MEETVGVKLVAQDMASGAISKVRTELSGMGGAGGIASKGLGLAERAVSGAGGAINHLKGTIGGLISGPLGFLGLTAGVLGFGGALKTGIDTLNQTALSIEKLTGITGEDAAAMSGLLAVTGKFNISSDQLGTIVGFTEKTLGKLSQTYVKTAAAGKSAALQSLENQRNSLLERNASTKKIDALIKEQTARDALTRANTKALPPETKLQALEKQYGVTLTDSTGKALNYSQVLNNVSDYYNSNATAGQKAALAATVFGRGYAVLIPVLKLGSKGFAEAQQAATALGLTLNDSNEQDLKDYQETMRETGDAVSGFELQLSLRLMPAVKTVASALTRFIADPNNRQNIFGFFQGVIDKSREAAGFLTGTVIPDLQSLAGTAIGFWNSLPPELRDILVKGFVAGRAMKFLFGFDPITTIGSMIGKQILGELGKGLGAVLGGIGGKIASTVTGGVAGHLAPQDVFITGYTPGLFTGMGGNPLVVGGEDAGAAAAAGGSAGFLADLAAGLGGLAIAAMVPIILNQLINGDPAKTGADDLKARQAIAAGRGLNPANVPTDITGRRSNALPPGVSLQDYGAAVGRSADELTAIKEINAQQLNAFPASQQAVIGRLAASEHADAAKVVSAIDRATQHAKDKAAVGGSGKAFHDFLMELRHGSIAKAVKDAPKEVSYMLSASDATKATAQYASGLRQDINAFKHDEIGATGSQKVVLQAAINRLETALHNKKLSVTVKVSTSITNSSIAKGQQTYKNYNSGVYVA